MPVLLMFYRRHLPHWQRPDSPLFITWRLFGSLPRRTLLKSRGEQNSGKKFVLLDRELDRASYGPTWLKDPRLAERVVEILQEAAEQNKLFRLSAFVIMSNHVHILIWPFAFLETITRTIKGFSAHEANCILGRTGHRFWQDESFDHAVRNEEEFYRIQKYIEQNPVKARLVESAEDWKWSSAAKRFLPKHRLK
ncbi:MAG TPA: transposase [Pyrinomonadaceae bacterium]|nr:transposase [Pyrinomonadaceae bacterium]